MNWQLRWHYLKSWGENLIGFRVISAILSSFGTLWLSVEITTFFLQGTQVPNLIRSLWFIFGSVGIIIAACLCRPHLSVSSKLNGRDITIEIAIGDLFTFPGALIVGTNTTFDTHISRELISEKSIQGLFTRKYYGDETQLDTEISTKLDGLKYERLTGHRIGKTKRYEMGTVVRLNPKERTAYLVAIADINEHGVASSNFDLLKESLAKLWVFIGRRGLKESLVMPVIGTGFCRLPQPREEIVREIIKSFIAACSELTFCDKLTIVLSPNDIERHNVAFKELGLYLQHMCKYANLSNNNKSLRIGTPIQWNQIRTQMPNE